MPARRGTPGTGRPCRRPTRRRVDRPCIPPLPRSGSRARSSPWSLAVEPCPSCPRSQPTKRRRAGRSSGRPRRCGGLGPAGTSLRPVTHVLLATDADWLRDDVQAALADDDTQVSRVHRGTEVIEAVAALKPDLVILDLQIGNMGG